MGPTPTGARHAAWPERRCPARHCSAAPLGGTHWDLLASSRAVAVDWTLISQPLSPFWPQLFVRKTAAGVAFLDRMIALRERIESGKEGLDQARPAPLKRTHAAPSVRIGRLLSYGGSRLTASLGPPQEFVMGAAENAGAHRCALPKTLFAGYCEDAHDELSRVSVRQPAGPRPSSLQLSPPPPPRSPLMRPADCGLTAERLRSLLRAGDRDVSRALLRDAQRQASAARCACSLRLSSAAPRREPEHGPG